MGKEDKDREMTVSLSARQSNTRDFEGNSSDEGGRVVWKKIGREEFKIILKSRQSRELRKKIREAEMVKSLRDGSLLVTCKTEDQKNISLQIDSICKKIIIGRILGESNAGSDNRYC